MGEKTEKRRKKNPRIPRQRKTDIRGGKKDVLSGANRFTEVLERRFPEGGGVLYQRVRWMISSWERLALHKKDGCCGVQEHWAWETPKPPAPIFSPGPPTPNSSHMTPDCTIRPFWDPRWVATHTQNLWFDPLGEEKVKGGEFFSHSFCPSPRQRACLLVGAFPHLAKGSTATTTSSTLRGLPGVGRIPSQGTYRRPPIHASLSRPSLFPSPKLIDYILYALPSLRFRIIQMWWGTEGMTPTAIW